MLNFLLYLCNNTQKDASVLQQYRENLCAPEGTKQKCQCIGMDANVMMMMMMMHLDDDYRLISNYLKTKIKPTTEKSNGGSLWDIAVEGA